MSRLNEQQEAVVKSTANRILCLAGAGAGKTHTMIERLRYLVANGVSPRNILVLTFTNAAATEMRSRYIQSETDEAPEFRTFHSFCYNLICTDKMVQERLGYRETPTIIDEISEKRIRTTILSELSIKIPAKVLDGQSEPSIKDRKSLEIYEKRFRKELLRTSQITFDILCYDVCKLFTTNDESIFQYKMRYKYIFVDEFQDTDSKQYAFITAFKNSNLFVVGDASQAIYGFRGADSSIIKSLAKSRDWTTYKLDHNYRSTKQICDYANAIAKRYADDTIYLQMQSDVYGDKPNIHYYSDLDSSYEDLCERVRLLDGTTAILARTNREVADIGKALVMHEISHITNTTDDHVRYILMSVLDSGFYADFLSSLLDMSTYLRCIRDRQVQQPIDIPEFIINNYGNGYMKHIQRKVDTIKQAVTNGLSRNQSPAALCQWVIQQFRPSYSDMPTAVENTINSIIQTAITILEQMSQTNSTIYLGTIHSVKGLEYDNVILTGVYDNSFRIKNEEMNNLYYVACTRAKKHLIVYIREAEDNIDGIDRIAETFGEVIGKIIKEVRSQYANFED